MKTSFPIVAVFACSILLLPSFSSAEHQYSGFDNHPRVIKGKLVDGPGGTGKNFTFDIGNPKFRVEPASKLPGECPFPFLAGTAFGHPDPRIKDPKAVCGHGVVFPLTHGTDTGTLPLLILPITTLVPPESSRSTNLVIADSSRVVRNQLPIIDKPEGDDVPEVVEIRKAIRSQDLAKAKKDTPKPAQK